MALASRALMHRGGLVIFLGVISGALFYGDAIITPALSVLSAIEGLKIVTPAFDAYVVPLTVGVLVSLFAVQSRGTASVAAFFGPIMMFWFLAIAVAGIWHVGQNLRVLLAFNPWYGVNFLLHHGIVGSLYARRCFSGRDRRGSTLCRSGALWSWSDPRRVAGRRAAGASCQLSRAGCARLTDPKSVENPFFLLFPDWALLPMVVLANDRDGDRQPGCNHRRLFSHPPGNSTRTFATF